MFVLTKDQHGERKAAFAPYSTELGETRAKYSGKVMQLLAPPNTLPCLRSKYKRRIEVVVERALEPRASDVRRLQSTIY